MEENLKQLLLKDLCARLPHGVIIHNEEGYEGHLNSINQTIFGIELGVNITATRRVDFQLDTCKPYLRPMSSMTEEEDKEWQSYKCSIAESCDRRLEEKISALHNWFNSRHLDWRGLIPIGLALEAPAEMYKTE